MSERFRHGEITKAIIGAFYDVYNAFGYGFLEKVHESALAVELSRLGIKVRQHAPINGYYLSQPVGVYPADLLINDLVNVELKAVKSIAKEHGAQLLNYLKSTRFEVGLLCNFGPEPKFVRKVLDISRKGSLDWTRKG